MAGHAEGSESSLIGRTSTSKSMRLRTGRWISFSGPRSFGIASSRGGSCHHMGRLHCIGAIVDSEVGHAQADRRRSSAREGRLAKLTPAPQLCGGWCFSYRWTAASVMRFSERILIGRQTDSPSVGPAVDQCVSYACSKGSPSESLIVRCSRKQGQPAHASSHG